MPTKQQADTAIAAFQPPVTCTCANLLGRTGEKSVAGSNPIIPAKRAMPVDMRSISQVRVPNPAKKL
jgi:hypothetical protein